MFNNILFVFALLLALLIVIRRFSKRNKSDLETYIRQHEKDAHSQIEAMRLETRRFGAHEALAPVEAGLHELLNLHGNPADIELARKDDTLILCAPDINIAIAWDFRAAHRATPAASKHIYGKGQWELRIGEGHPELYTRLGSLMARLSPLVRALATHSPLQDFSLDTPPFLPGRRQSNLPLQQLPDPPAPAPACPQEDDKPPR